MSPLFLLSLFFFDLLFFLVFHFLSVGVVSPSSDSTLLLLWEVDRFWLLDFCLERERGRERMDRLCIGQNYSSDDVVRGVYERKDAAFCPKPRRLGQLICNADGIRPLSFHISHQPDLNDSTAAGAEILDIILTKNSYDGHDQLSGSQISYSPPYFCGSPPSRSANPLVHDARFLEEKHHNAPLTPPFLSPSSSLSPSAAARNGGCARPTAKFGPNPAVRIEGFDCLNRDGCGCGIPAVA